MIWNNVAKPSVTSYTTIAFQGKEYYDDPAVTYDSPLTYYDGVNMSQWTDIAKPKGIFKIVPGMATGLIMSPTYPQNFINTEWTDIPKPI